MTRDDVIRMAREARLPCNHPDWADATERFAALVAAAEREECAKTVDDAQPFGKIKRTADAIRARGTHEA